MSFYMSSPFIVRTVHWITGMATPTQGKTELNLNGVKDLKFTQTSTDWDATPGLLFQMAVVILAFLAPIFVGNRLIGKWHMIG